MDNVFLIQKEYEKTIDGYMIRSMMENYASWYLDKYVVEGDEYELLPRENLVPVGNIPFVQKFLSAKMKPFEVPEELRKFLEREYFICKGKDIPTEYLNENYFFKDADTLKLWNNALDPYDLSIARETNYVVSKRVYFDAEYRVFVHEKDVVGIKLYLGEPLIFPDAGKIRDMVHAYDGPDAYTMDIGIHNGKTDILEVHPFACCGLYGLYDKEVIPMLKKGFAWYQKQ